MPKQVKLRRGTTAQHASFTGAAGEITVDTTKKTVVVHDGATAGGFPLAPETALLVKAAGVVLVDPVNGNDATGQRCRLQAPFATLTGAKTAAQSGDTIMVLPGTYNEKNLAKNGVNWFFLKGAVVNYQGLAAGGIFDTSLVGSYCVFSVRGQGEFYNMDGPMGTPIIKCAYGGDMLDIECDLIEASGPAVDTVGTVSLRCRDMMSDFGSAVVIGGSGNLVLVAQTIIGAEGYAIDMAAGKADVTAKTIMSTGGKAIRFTGGTMDLMAQEVKSVADAALEYNSAASALCRIRHTRLVSTAGGGVGKAVVVTSGSGNLRLVACALVGQAPATVSIDATAATNVVLYGECTANLAQGANVTLVGSALTVNSSLT